MATVLDQDNAHNNGEPYALTSALTNLLHNTVRRYDLLVARHTDMCLQKGNFEMKKSLSRAFVGKTIDDMITVFNSESFRNILADYVCDSTEHVISKCRETEFISSEALRRVHFSYLYCLCLMPNAWINDLRCLENVCYRDTSSVYNRFVAVKTFLMNVFKVITDTVLGTLFNNTTHRV